MTMDTQNNVINYLTIGYRTSFHFTLSYRMCRQNVFSSYRTHKQKIWYVTIVNNKDNIMYGDGLMAMP